MSLNLPRVKHACRAISRDLEVEGQRAKERALKEALNPEVAKEVRRTAPCRGAPISPATAEEAHPRTK